MIMRGDMKICTSTVPELNRGRLKKVMKHVKSLFGDSN